jgi:hypothetical protein
VYYSRLRTLHFTWPGVGAGRYAANAVEYCTVLMYDALRERYNTATKNTATLNITTEAYRTRTVCNK